MKRIMIIVIVLLLTLSGCASAAATSTASIQTTTTVKPTTQAATTQATTTAKSALTADQVLQKLKSAGMPVSNIVVFTEATDPNKQLGRPNQYTSKANFSDPAHKDTDKASPDNTVEVFAVASEAKARAEYVKSATASMPALAQYIYQEGVYVLRINHEILPSDAKKYETAFLAAVK